MGGAVQDVSDIYKGNWGCSMHTVIETEAERLSEQSRLDLLKDARERNRWGQFATPPELAADILSCVHELFEDGSEPIRFLDPGVGSGSFYSALLQCTAADRIQNASGIELDPVVAQVARHLWAKSGLTVVEGDFTLQPPRLEFNLVVSNPPYIRHHHLTSEQKERMRAVLRQRLGFAPSGLAGMYVYFLLLADAWLEPGGFGAWLVPSEFLDVNYGEALRRYLSEHVSLLRLHRFAPSDVQFSDALVSSAVVIFRKRRPAGEHRVTLSFGGSLARPEHVSERTSMQLAADSKWAQPGCGAAAVRNHDECSVLGDLFSIKRGLATGANNFFILDEEEAVLLGIAGRCTRPILPSPRYLREDVILADPDGFPQVNPRLHLIDTDLDEDTIRRLYPKFWDYLQEGIAQGVNEGYLASRRSPWYSQEKRPPAPFLCTYMGRTGKGRSAFRFLWNRSLATAHNVFLLLYPKPELQEFLGQSSDRHQAVFDALRQIEATEITAGGRVYGGGLHKVEPRELGRISVRIGPVGLKKARRSLQTSLFG